MKKEVLAYIKQNKMIKKKDMILAGVSGGSDSMAMLHILRELQEEVDFSLKVVHVHHGIRGQEADRDSSFVEKICKEWQIPCKIRSSGQVNRTEHEGFIHRKDTAAVTLDSFFVADCFF